MLHGNIYFESAELTPVDLDHAAHASRAFDALNVTQRIITTHLLEV